jgi:hypothetical protein
MDGNTTDQSPDDGATGGPTWGQVPPNVPQGAPPEPQGAAPEMQGAVPAAAVGASAPRAVHRSGGVAATVAAMTSRDWTVGVLTGVGAYVVAYVVGVLLMILTVVVIGASNSGSGVDTGSGASSSGSGASNVSDVLSVIGNVLAGPAQLIGLADLGRLAGRGAGVGTVTLAGSAQLGLVPVFIALAQVIALVVIRRLAGRRTEPFGVRLLTSLVTGVVLALLTLVVGLVFAFRIPAISGVSISAINAIGPGSVIVALLVGTGVTLVARPIWLSRVHPIVNAGLGILRVAATHLGALSVFTALVLVVASAVVRTGSGPVLPLLLSNLAIVVTAISMFGGVSFSESTGQLFSTLGRSASPTGTLTVFSSPTGWVWLLVLAAVVAAVLAGLGLAVRRGTRARPQLDWALSVAAYLLLGVVVLVVGTVVFRVTVSGIGGTGSAGVTPWTPVVFGVWGAVVEVVARWVAPRVLPALPSALVAIASRLVGRDAAGYRPLPVGEAPVSAPTQQAPVSATTQEAPPTATVGAAAGSTEGAQQQQPYGWGGAAETPMAPMTPRARRILVRSLVAAGVVVVLVVGGAVTGSVLRSSVWGPGPVAEQFVAAIGKGDASGAGELGEVRGIGTGMLTDRVLGGATGRISDVAVGAVRKSGDSATATVTYRQGGDRRSTFVTLRRTGTTWLVKDDWQVTSSLIGVVGISVPEALGNAEVRADGVTVGRAKDGELSLDAFPGTYDITVGGTKYFSGQKSTVTVSAQDSAVVQVRTKPTTALSTEAKKLVTDATTACARQTTGDLPDSCPFYGPYGTTSGVHYTIRTMPDLTVEVESDGTIDVTSSTDGQIETKYSDVFAGETFPHDDTDSFRIDEYLRVRKGALVVDDRY